MTRYVCRDCRRVYDRPEAVEARYNHDHPEAAGRCLECIGAVARAMMEEA